MKKPPPWMATLVATPVEETSPWTSIACLDMAMTPLVELSEVEPPVTRASKSVCLVL